MKTTTRRIALLTGASLTAIGLAVPAYAQDITSPGISHTDVTPPVTDTLIICNLADLPEDCFYGVVDEDPATATANVNTVATGEIEQIGTAPSGDVDLLIVNDGDAVVGAYAEAGPNEAGPAVAVATVQTAILQQGTGPEDVTLTVDNNGSLLITADADADGDAATATADVYRGIYQDGTSTGADGIVTVTLTNDGPLAVVADADALADDVGGIADTEKEARALIEFLGLPWNDKCVDFHKSDRPVKTASVAQVRQPIYNTSVKRWQKYGAGLKPLIDAINGSSAGKRGPKRRAAATA